MELLAWFLLIVSFVIFSIALFGIVQYSIKIVFYKRELKNAKRVRLLTSAVSVEAEVLEICEKRLSELDVQYTAKLAYSVGERFFYKDYVFINRASLRKGAKISLLIDVNEPDKAVVEDGSQASSLRKMISRMIGNIILVIISSVFLYLNFLITIGEAAGSLK